MREKTIGHGYWGGVGGGGRGRLGQREERRFVFYLGGGLIFVFLAYEYESLKIIII